MKHAYETAFPDSEDDVFEFLDKGLSPRVGILQPNGTRGARLPFVNSGLGDGVGPVFELRNGAKRIGVDAEFISLL